MARLDHRLGISYGITLFVRVNSILSNLIPIKANRLFKSNILEGLIFMLDIGHAQSNQFLIASHSTPASHRSLGYSKSFKNACVPFHNNFLQVSSLDIVNHFILFQYIP
jgi:hypothetical protein